MSALLMHVQLTIVLFVKIHSKYLVFKKKKREKKECTSDIFDSMAHGGHINTYQYIHTGLPEILSYCQV